MGRRPLLFCSPNQENRLERRGLYSRSKQSNILRSISARGNSIDTFPPNLFSVFCKSRSDVRTCYAMNLVLKAHLDNPRPPFPCPPLSGKRHPKPYLLPPDELLPAARTSTCQSRARPSGGTERLTTPAILCHSEASMTVTTLPGRSGVPRWSNDD